MPYIDQALRARILELPLKDLVYQARTLKAGDLNFIISILLWGAFKDCPCYTKGNMVMGVLESAKAEFYRRCLAPYEDQKILEHGDIKL